MGGRRILLTGATGMVGGLVLRDLLARPVPEVAEVVGLGRRETGLVDSRLREVPHADAGDYESVSGAFDAIDAGIFCLGAYTGAVPEAELRRLTVDAVVDFATVLAARSPDAVFCLLSGQGADRTERSRIAFARFKGMAENAVLARGFPRVHLFRPGYIYSVEPRREPNLGYRVMRVLWPLARRIYPNLGVRSDDLARAMVHAALYGTGTHRDPVLENREIRRLARRISEGREETW